MPSALGIPCCTAGYLPAHRLRRAFGILGEEDASVSPLLGSAFRKCLFLMSALGMYTSLLYSCVPHKAKALHCGNN